MGPVSLGPLERLIRDHVGMARGWTVGAGANPARQPDEAGSPCGDDAGKNAHRRRASSSSQAPFGKLPTAPHAEGPVRQAGHLWWRSNHSNPPLDALLIRFEMNSKPFSLG